MKHPRLLSLCLAFLFLLGFAACTDPDSGLNGPGGAQAKTYTVSYYYDEDGDGIALGEPDEIDTVEENRRAVLLSLAPTASSEIEGWYLRNEDGTMGAKWDINTPVTADIALIANWRTREFAVHYYVDGREAFSAMVPYGQPADDVYVLFPDECLYLDEWKAHIDAGEVFLGWQTENGVMWNFEEDTVKEKLMLLAVFGNAA